MHSSRHFKLIKEMKEIYWLILLQTFVVASIGIFIPIYILESGYSLIDAVSYLFVLWLALGVFSPVSGIISSKIGLKYTIVLRTPFLMLYFLFLHLFDIFNLHLYFLYLLACFFGFIEALYWVSLTSYFAKKADSIHRDEQVGYFFSIEKFVRIIAPVIAGMIIVYLSFPTLFTFALVILVISIYPLLKLRGRVYESIKWGKIFSKKRLDIFFGYIASGGAETAYVLIWPIFVYHFLDILNVGFAFSIASLGFVLSSIFIGSISNKSLRSELIKISAIFYTLAWFSRIFVVDQITVMAVSFITGAGFGALTVTFFSYVCETAKKEGSTGIMILRQFGLAAGRIISLLVFLAVIFYNLDFINYFIIVGLFPLLFLFISLKK